MAVRFLVDNYITTPSMLTMSSERGGQIGLAVKVGSGSATLVPAGAYTGDSPDQYLVQIHDISGGYEVGQSKFWWWRASTGLPPLASGVVTSVAPGLLEKGVSVGWAHGSGNDFAYGDYWTVSVDKPFGKRNLIDGDRDTEWRTETGTTSATIIIDFGSSKLINAVALLDTNFRAASVVTVYGSDDLGTLWVPVSSYTTGYGVEPYGVDPYGGSPASLPSVYGLTNGVYYLVGTRTYRYWGIAIDDTFNPDGYLRMGELYFGDYVEFSRGYNYGVIRSRSAATYGPSGALRQPRGLWAAAELLNLQYHLMTDTDRTKALALFDFIYNTDHGIVRGIIVNPDNTNGSDVSLYELEDPTLPISSQLVGRHDWQLNLRQRTRIARSGI